MLPNVLLASWSHKTNDSFRWYRFGYKIVPIFLFQVCLIFFSVFSAYKIHREWERLFDVGNRNEHRHEWRRERAYRLRREEENFRLQCWTLDPRAAVLTEKKRKQ